MVYVMKLNLLKKGSESALTINAYNLTPSLYFFVLELHLTNHRILLPCRATKLACGTLIDTLASID